MTTQDAVSNLIGRYVFAVGEELPRRLRDDVTRELRTLVEDKLDDRARTLGKAADVALATYVLQEIGEPGEVARRYDPSPQYLVGPRFYPAFVKVLRIAVVGLAILLLLTNVLTHALSPEATATLLTFATLGRLVRAYFQTGIMLFGEAVIVLAILERTTLGQKFSPSGEWDPRELAEVPEAEEDRIAFVGVAVDVCLAVLFGMVLNFLPEWVGFITIHGKSQTTFVSVRDVGIHLPILAINVWLALSIGLRLALLSRRRWTPSTRWAQVALGVFASGIFMAVAATSSPQAPPGLPALDPLLRVIGSLLYVAPFAVLIGPLLNAVKLLRDAWAPPPGS